MLLGGVSARRPSATRSSLAPSIERLAREEATEKARDISPSSTAMQVRCRPPPSTRWSVIHLPQRRDEGPDYRPRGAATSGPSS